MTLLPHIVNAATTVHRDLDIDSWNARRSAAQRRAASMAITEHETRMIVGVPLTPTTGSGRSELIAQEVV